MSGNTKMKLITAGIILAVIVGIFGVLCFITWIVMLIINAIFTAHANYWAVFGVVTATPIVVCGIIFIVRSLKLKEIETEIETKLEEKKNA